APLAGVPWSRLVKESAVVTPAAREDAPGDAVVFTDLFPTNDGRATLRAASLVASPEQTNEEYPFVLSTGRVLEHWHTGAMTRRATMLDALAPTATVAINPDDAKTLAIANGDHVVVTSRHGEVVAVADCSTLVAKGQAFIPFAYWEAAANKLTGDALDPFGKIPGFKVTAVRMTRTARARENEAG
ncbi:MAG: molybdopterin oxidoreductase family protein, partial [Casimicrobium sp.]